ncbi:MAG: cyclic nucleotide-binding domain-containing protein [Chloroflexi bacterium]|nr:cyclic nucleotide-binding domain-containing protein [Chloroflexota bacterium]
MAEFDERLDLLRRIRLFTSFTEEELHQINQLLKPRRFRKGSTIFQQGDPGDALYIVESGRVKATITDEQGHERIVALYGEGEYFGEMALLTDQPRSATLTVTGDATLLVLPKEAFERFLATNTQVMKQLLQVMTRRVAESNVQQPGSAEPEQVSALGKVVVMFSPKGGTGKTTLAVNLAVALRQEANRSVVLVDCAYPFGDVGVMMNLEPKRTISDLMPQVNELDGEIIEDVLQPHPSGVKVLLAPATPEDSEVIIGEHVTLVLTALRELFEYVIVDTHGSFSDVSLAAMDMADLVFVVATMELPVLKNVRLFVDTVTTKLGYPQEKVALVVNRAGPVGGLSLQDVEAAVGLQVAASVASSGMLAVTAANRSTPFAVNNKDSQIYQDVLNLAKLLAPKAVGDNQFGLGDLEGDEEKTRMERLLRLPRVVLAQARTGIKETRPADVFFGLGNMLLVSAPLLFVVTVLGWIARALEADFPTGAALNLSIWIGIAVGAFALVRMRQQTPSWFWLQGTVLGAVFGLLIALPAISAVNATQGTVSAFSFLLAIVFYAVLGLAGTIAGQRLRRGPRILLGR